MGEKNNKCKTLYYAAIQEDGKVGEIKELQMGGIVNEEVLQFEESPPAMVIPPQNCSLTLELSKQGQRKLKRILSKNEKKIRKATRLINKALRYLPKETEINVNMEKCDLKTEIVTNDDLHFISSEIKLKKE